MTRKPPAHKVDPRALRRSLKHLLPPDTRAEREAKAQEIRLESPNDLTQARATAEAEGIEIDDEAISPEQAIEISRSLLESLTGEERLALEEQLLAERIRRTQSLKRWQVKNRPKTRGYAKKYREKQKILSAEAEAQKARERSERFDRRLQVKEMRLKAETVLKTLSKDLSPAAAKKARREMLRTTGAGLPWPLVRARKPATEPRPVIQTNDDKEKPSE